MARAEVTQLVPHELVRNGLSPERRAVYARGAAHIRTRMQDKSFGPLATRTDLSRLVQDNPDTGVLAARVFSLIGQQEQIPDFGEVPESGEFTVLNQDYRGADGRRRMPLPKYLPNPIAPHIAEMQQAYLSYLRSQGQGARPGIVIDSAYRSPYYQVGVLAKRIGEAGMEEAISTITVPGTSQHAMFDECAFDITNIGNRNGRIVRDDGTPIGFEQTREFRWLIDHAPRFGLWLPYYPNPENPTGDMSASGIVVEPWHFQFINGAAEARTREHRARDLFATFAESRRIIST